VYLEQVGGSRKRPVGLCVGKTLKTRTANASRQASYEGHERKGRLLRSDDVEREDLEEENPRGERTAALGNTGVGVTDSAKEQSPEGGMVVTGAWGNSCRRRRSTDERARADDESAQAVAEEQTPEGRTLDVAAG